MSDEELNLTPDEIAVIKSRRKKANKEAAKDKPIVGRYKLLSGGHREGGVTYQAGVPGRDIIDSTSELDKRFGYGKFQRIGDGTAPAPKEVKQKDEEAEKSQVEPEDTNYEDMTVAQLKEIAVQEEIDLKGAHRKDEIIQAIRDAGL